MYEIAKAYGNKHFIPQSIKKRLEEEAEDDEVVVELLGEQSTNKLSGQNKTTNVGDEKRISDSDSNVGHSLIENMTVLDPISVDSNLRSTQGSYTSVKKHRYFPTYCFKES
jgi:hypothetical protein